jgi:probable F420-dependent oxidoreductase
MKSTGPSRPLLSVTLRSWASEDPGGWGTLLEQADALDRIGVDRLVVSDHVVFGEHLEEYGRPEIGGQAGGKQPTGPDGHWLEPLTLLSVIAGRTRRIRLGTNILIAALRRPAVLAKVTSTLDVLSGGRLDLGVGVGWQREEYEATGLAFDGRGRLLDETLRVCRVLWTSERAGYESPSLRFEGIHMMPKPVQPGGVPIWVSGTVNPRVARRLAEFGSGWIPWGDAAADLPEGIRRMRASLEAEGRDLSEIDVVGNLPLKRSEAGQTDLAATMDPVPGLTEIGVTDFRIALSLGQSGAETEDRAAPLVEAFRAAVGRSGD